MEHVTIIINFFFDQSNNILTPACLSVTINDCRFLWNCRLFAKPL